MQARRGRAHQNDPGEGKPLSINVDRSVKGKRLPSEALQESTNSPFLVIPLSAQHYTPGTGYTFGPPVSAAFSPSLPEIPASEEDRRQTRYSLAESSLAEATLHTLSEPSRNELKIRVLQETATRLNARAQEAQDKVQKLRALLADRNMDPVTYREMQKARWMEERVQQVVASQSDTVRNAILQSEDAIEDKTGASASNPQHANLIEFFERTATKRKLKGRRGRWLAPQYLAPRLAMRDASPMRLQPQPYKPEFLRKQKDDKSSKTAARPQATKDGITQQSKRDTATTTTIRVSTQSSNGTTLYGHDELNGKDTGKVTIYQSSSLNRDNMAALQALEQQTVSLPGYVQELMNKFDDSQGALQFPLNPIPSTPTKHRSNLFPRAFSRASTSRPLPTSPSSPPRRATRSQSDVTVWDVISPNATRAPETPKKHKKHRSFFGTSGERPSSLLMLLSKPKAMKRPSQRPMSMSMPSKSMSAIPESPRTPTSASESSKMAGGSRTSLRLSGTPRLSSLHLSETSALGSIRTPSKTSIRSAQVADEGRPSERPVSTSSRMLVKEVSRHNVRFSDPPKLESLHIPETPRLGSIRTPSKNSVRSAQIIDEGSSSLQTPAEPEVAESPSRIIEMLQDSTPPSPSPSEPPAPAPEPGLVKRLSREVFGGGSPVSVKRKESKRKFLGVGW